jgi:hypothetical protein
MTTSGHSVRDLGRLEPLLKRSPPLAPRPSGNTGMPPAHAAELELAELAHRLWCQEMIAEGWSPGPFDPVKKTHDALVSFEGLGVVDRHSTALGIESLELIDRLRSVVEYPRGEDREFSRDEVSVGLRVGSSDEPDQFGTVLSWEEDPHWQGCLQTITVRWDSGEVNVHAAAERELRRLSQPDS